MHLSMQRGTQAPPPRSVAPCLLRGAVCAEGAGGDSVLPSPQTRVLVTHSISFLPQMDFIIVLADGQVSEVGTYSALLQCSGSFATFIHNYAPETGEEPLEEGSRTGIPGFPYSCAPCLGWGGHL